VIGLAPWCACDQGRVTLEPDDLVVAFTDGIKRGDQCGRQRVGEERVMQLIEAIRAWSARELIDRIMRRAGDFDGYASQHDDMTVVTVRVAKGPRDAVSA